MTAPKKQLHSLDTFSVHADEGTGGRDADPAPLATVLAFDLGASSGRALVGELITTKEGTAALRIAEIHRFENQAIQVGKHLHWDILRLLHELKNGIRKAFQAGYAPQTLGIDTWGVDFGLLDANGELLGNPYHYRDAQTEGMIEAVNERIGREALFAQSGLQLMPFNTLYQLYAMKLAGSAQLSIAKQLLLTPDLLHYLLTGVAACEFTMATTTQLLDPRTEDWNTPLMSELDIPSTLFLETIRPGTIIGRLSPEVLAELDVSPMDAVAVGSHDTASAIAAVPAGQEPFAYLVCGTWSLLGTELASPLLHPDTLALSFSNEGGVGDTYQLLKNIMGLWILQECRAEWELKGSPFSYPELVAEAQRADPFRSLIDPDNARFFSPGGMTEKIRSFCKETMQPEPRTEGEFVRCILESLALCYRQTLTQAEQLTNERFGGLHMVGGGIQNTLLCQFTADAIGRPVWAGPVEASAIGNMLMQLVAIGKCADLSEARRLVANSFPVKVYEPGPAGQWSEVYTRFCEVIRSA